ncbi:hypothetical protein ACOTFF_13910 [Achromobacter xylosoxidans]
MPDLNAVQLPNPTHPLLFQKMDIDATNDLPVLGQASPEGSVHLRYAGNEPLLAAQIREQLKKGPDSLRLYLGEGLAVRSQQLALAYEAIEKLRAADIPEDVADSLRKILDSANTDEIVEGNQILGQYAQFMSDLSALMVRINSLIGQNNDGKPVLHTRDMLEAMEDFRKKYAGDAGILKSFTSEADAKAFQEKFRGGTVTIEQQRVKGKIVYNVRFNTLAAVEPIIHSLCDTKSNADAAIRLIQQGAAINDDRVYQLTRALVTNSAVVQGISLATSDVQKTFQTDLDLQINGLSRSIAQFDNLAKLYSSLISSLTDTYKSFLG